MKTKTNYIWVGIIVAVIVLAIVFISNSDKIQQDSVTCNSPYIKVGTSCCLDENSNSVCDNDEQILELQDYCGDNLCQPNEKAPSCSDCKPNIRIENLQYLIFKPSNILSSKDFELKITNYNIIQTGDPVVVYPSLDIYQGNSEEQCKSKNSMSLFKDNLLCPEECSYSINEEDYYGLYSGSYKLGGLDPNSSCIYFVFELKPYPKEGVSAYESETIQSIAKYESQIVNLRNIH